MSLAMSNASSRVLYAAEADDRAEHLLSRDLHLRCDVAQDCWGQESLAGDPGEGSGALPRSFAPASVASSIHAATRSPALVLISELTVVAGSAGSPTPSFSTRDTTASASCP